MLQCQTKGAAYRTQLTDLQQKYNEVDVLFYLQDMKLQIKALLTLQLHSGLTVLSSHHG